MRDMPVAKFQRAARGMGFNPLPVGALYTAADGLRCAAQYTRRDTLARMSALRKTHPYVPGRIAAGPAADPSASIHSQNEEPPARERRGLEATSPV